MLLWKHRTVLFLVALLVGVPLGAGAVSTDGASAPSAGDASRESDDVDPAVERLPSTGEGEMAAIPPELTNVASDRLLPTSLPVVASVGTEGDGWSRLMLGADLEARVDERILDVHDLVDGGHVDPSGRIRVIVSADLPGRALLSAGSLLTQVQDLPGLGLLIGDLMLDDLPAVLQVPGVERVDHAGIAKLHLSASVPLVRADQVHQRQDANGDAVRGKGVKIAVLDTGVDYTHAHLGGCLGTGCKVVSGHDYINDDADPMDDNGHGTHVAAIAAGSHGVAPDASIVALKVCDASGTCPETAIVEALEDLLTSDVDIISMSFGSTSQCLHCALNHAVEKHLDSRVVVASAGNAGPTQGTMSTPANMRGVLAVGASDKLDRLADFSSRGPVYDRNALYAMKPDVVAPGVGIRAAVPTGSCQLCDPSGEAALSGTSMAAPHASGTAALVLQEHPEWSSEDVGLAIANGAVPLGERSLAEGTGRIDALAATTADVVLTPHNSFSGYVPTGTTSYTLERTLTVKNLHDDERNVTFAADAARWSTAFTPTNITLGGAESQDVIMTLSGDRADLSPGWNDGKASAATSTGQALVRHSILHDAVIHFNLSGGIPLGLWDHGAKQFLGLPRESKFDFAIGQGRYMPVIWYGCDFRDPRCDIAYVFGESFTLEDEHWVNITRSDAVHPVTMHAEPTPGEDLDVMGTPGCGAARSASLCKTMGKSLLLLNDRRYGVTAEETRRPVTVHVSDMDTMWSLGYTAGILRDTENWFWGNATWGTSGPVQFVQPHSALANTTIEHRLTGGWTEGLRLLTCVKGFIWVSSSTNPHIKPISDGMRERIHLDLDGGAWYEPCSIIRSIARAGDASHWFSCSDPLGCKVTAHSAPITLVDGVLAPRQSDAGGGMAFDTRQVAADGAYPVVDGAPTFSADVLLKGETLWVKKDREDIWVSGSGGTSAFGTFGWSPHRYKYAEDGVTLASGTSHSWWLRTTSPDKHILYQNDHRFTHLDGATCAARQTYEFQRPDSDGNFPGVAWARVVNASGIGTRFDAASELTLLFGTYNTGTAPVTALNVTLLMGTSVVGSWTDPPAEADGSHALSLPDAGAGAYRLVIELRTADGERAVLRQDPAYIVGDGGCGVMPPVARAVAMADRVDIDENITLHGKGSYDPDDQNLTYQWSGDVSLAGRTVTTSFSTPGRRCVDLTVVDTDGLTDTDRICFVVGRPVAVSSATPGRANVDTDVTFSGEGSYDPGDLEITYEWFDWTGQQVAATRDHVVRFFAPGPKCLMLRVTNVDGAYGEDEACVSINTPPVAVPTASAQEVKFGTNVTFYGNTSYDPDGSIVSFVWAQDGVVLSNSTVFERQMTERGIQCLDLTVVDNESSSAGAEVCVTVYTEPVAVASVAPERANPDAELVFSSDGSYDELGEELEYTWYDGDVVVSTMASLTTAFSSPGVHCLTLVVTDAGGFTAEDEACVSINAPPVALASSSSDRARVGAEVVFDGDDSYDPDGTVLAYEWTRDGTVVSADATFVINFTKRGEHCLLLTVTDPDGMDSQDEACVLVHTSPIAVADASPGEGSVGYAFTFSGADSVSYEGNLSYLWTDQGVEVGTDVAIKRAFATTGTHCLTLTVTDEDGQTGIDEACVEVVPTLRVVVSPGKQTYGIREDAHVNSRVQHPTSFAYLEGVAVTLTVTYESGDPRIDAYLASVGCARQWEATSMTDALGRVSWQVASIGERCSGIATGGQLPNTLSGRYAIHAAAVMDGLYGEDTRSYRVWGV